MRVVSLVPSATESLVAWGVDVVACTRFCEQPGLRRVGGTKDPDVPAIIGLRPDLVVLDREENRLEDADALIAAGVPLHITQVTSIEQVGPTLQAMSVAVGVVPETIRIPPARPIVVRAFVAIWRRPWMTLNANTYGASVLRHLGVDNVFDDRGERYPVVTLDEVVERAPALVLLPSEPYPFTERHAREVRAALPHAEVRLIDGADLFWWGVRTPAALERLGSALGL